MNRDDFESALLHAPFDTGLRQRFADHLLLIAEPALAQSQFELCAQHDPSAAPLLGLAKALLAQEQREAALAAYQRARKRDGFKNINELDTLIRQARPIGPPRLGIVGDDGQVRTAVLAAPTARERITFADVSGLDDLKKTLRLQIIEPFLRPGLFAKFRKTAGGGVLLYGPPGCGKTLIARAVAGEVRGEFISVGVSDVVSMWFGESESLLADLFAKARAQKPCVLFFDELDALAYSRSKASSEHSRRIVNEFLAQLDGLASDNSEILILAATNMPWDIDPAMKRSGRFARQVFVSPPDDAARKHMFDTKLDGVPTEAVDSTSLARETPHYSGADVEGLIDLAKERVLGEIISGGAERPLCQQDLLHARAKLQASTLDWLRTARNLVRFGGADTSYRDVEQYLKQHRLS